jgi:hypothetical protein
MQHGGVHCRVSGPSPELPLRPLVLLPPLPAVASENCLHCAAAPRVTLLPSRRSIVPGYCRGLSCATETTTKDKRPVAPSLM